MASSFVTQIPQIVYLISILKPKKILDIGKGFGKYGFLTHEYLGINNKKRIDPSLPMAKQSEVEIDALEVDPDLMMPHLDQIYKQVYFGDVFELNIDFTGYNLILMVDVIEHLDKQRATILLKQFLDIGISVIVATPATFFEQTLYESTYEDHVSHWNLQDFKDVGFFVDAQKIDDGNIYLLTKTKTDIRGFGGSFIKKLRRIAKAIKNEL